MACSIELEAETFVSCACQEETAGIFKCVGGVSKFAGAEFLSGYPMQSMLLTLFVNSRGPAKRSASDHQIKRSDLNLASDSFAFE